jgi:hypothetical protein
VEDLPMDVNRARPSAVAGEQPPEQVTLVYRLINDAHTFTAVEVPGLVVLDPEFEIAFNDGLRGIGELVSRLSHQTVSYSADFEQFKKKVEQQARSTAGDGPVTVLGRANCTHMNVTV